MNIPTLHCHALPCLAPVAEIWVCYEVKVPTEDLWILYENQRILYEIMAALISYTNLVVS